MMSAQLNGDRAVRTRRVAFFVFVLFACFILLCCCFHARVVCSCAPLQHPVYNFLRLHQPGWIGNSVLFRYAAGWRRRVHICSPVLRTWR
jgi:hypothetical protein